LTPLSATPWPEKKKERGVAAHQPTRERVELVHQRLPADVLAGHHLEPDLRERATDRPRVVHGLLQLLAFGEVGVAVVADDEGDTLLRMGRGDGARERQPRGNDVKESHPPPPSKCSDVIMR
jgi:hypothetical protein